VGTTRSIHGPLRVTSGSPPRAWGQPSSSERFGRSRRFTPTGVGTTRRLCYSRLRLSVHPHGRGDNVVLDPFKPLQMRFTPTGVGTTPTTRLSVATTTVHPHGRGDNVGGWGGAIARGGSPPRAWGQLGGLEIPQSSSGFTPTGVGTTPGRRRQIFALAVHPHGRGDNALRAARAAGRHGSPPRAWGQQGRTPSSSSRARFTPTGVGTTQAIFSGPPRRTVHPHGRGDNSVNPTDQSDDCGSPPRAWGQPRHCPSDRRRSPVHPHGRGDNVRDLQEEK